MVTTTLTDLQNAAGKGFTGGGSLLPMADVIRMASHAHHCGPDNRLAEKGWITRKNTHGDTEWLPPAHLDHGQPRINTFHHPEKLLRDDDDEPD